MALKIVHYNEPVLRRKGEKVAAFDSALARLASEMIDTMHEAAGIGLAAQQVGRALQLCVVDLRESDASFAYELDGARPPKELFMPMAIANPVLEVGKGVPTEVVEEGCLSFPNIRGDVSRPVAITVRFQDEAGRPHVLSCDGLLSRCIQHEVDHLNGILFIERMNKAARAGVDKAVRALSKQTRQDGKTGA